MKRGRHETGHSQGNPTSPQSESARSTQPLWRNSRRLACWRQHLGISVIPTSPGESPWQQEAGPTAFAPFKETSGYFGDTTKVWMLNFRVRDLDKMAAQLRAAGIEVKINEESSPIGRFARVHDPEGNPIELWQPKVPDTKG